MSVGHPFLKRKMGLLLLASFLLGCGTGEPLLSTDGDVVSSCYAQNDLLNPDRNSLLPDVPAQQTLPLESELDVYSVQLNAAGDGFLISGKNHQNTSAFYLQTIRALNVDTSPSQPYPLAFGSKLDLLWDAQGNGQIIATRNQGTPIIDASDRMPTFISPPNDDFGIFQAPPNGIFEQVDLQAETTALAQFKATGPFQPQQWSLPLRWMGTAQTLVDDQGNGILSLMALGADTPPLDPERETVASHSPLRLLSLPIHNYQLQPQAEVQSFEVLLPNNRDHGSMRTWLNPNSQGMLLYRAGDEWFLRHLNAGQLGQLHNLGKGSEPQIEVDAQGNGYIYANTNGGHRYSRLQGFQVTCSQVINVPVTEASWVQGAFVGSQGVIVTLARPKQRGTVGAAEIQVHHVQGNQVVKSQTVVYPFSGIHALSGPSLRVNLLPNGQGFISWSSSTSTEKMFHLHSLKDFQPVAPLRWPGETQPIPDPGPVSTPPPVVFWAD
jgi:hypothetical protein